MHSPTPPSSPSPITPNPNPPTLSSLPPAYIALALTLLSSQLFAAVEPRDVLARLAGLRGLGGEWRREGGVRLGEVDDVRLRGHAEGEAEPGESGKEGETTLAPEQEQRQDTLSRWVESNARLGVWASAEVLRGKSRRGRARALERLIECAEECRALSNHSSMSTLLSSLNAPPISRLMHTWALVSSHHLELLMKLRDVLPPRTDIARYSERVELPCVPPLSLFLHTTADTEGPLRLYREIKRYQSSCALYPQLLEERLAALPPPQQHQHQHGAHHSPPVSGTSTPTSPHSGASTPASPHPPQHAAHTPSPLQATGSGSQSPPQPHHHASHTHHAHHSHHAHAHLRSLSGTSTPGSLHSIPEEEGDASLSASPDSPDSRERSPSLSSASSAPAEYSPGWWGLPDTPLAPLALQHQLHQLHTPHLPPPPPPPQAGAREGSYFAYLPHVPRAPSPLRVARPWLDRWEDGVREHAYGREGGEGMTMRVPEGHVHLGPRGEGVDGEEQGQEHPHLGLETGPHGTEGPGEADGQGQRTDLSPTLMGEQQPEPPSTPPRRVRSPDTPGVLGEPGSPRTPVHSPEPYSPRTPYSPNLAGSPSPQTPRSPPAPHTPHPHPHPHPHPPPARPRLADLLHLLQTALAAVDTSQDLWELSAKAERLTREDVEMREIVMMSERAGAGWGGVGLGV
ncbi:ras GEF [Calocera cornea HHB12733]|uniref:Ras GEF n=1 Tax=Calocera cornea HHB12733 TaxID=1353952 RepID=A0A165GKZ0_9BASI|nr:ras GEF [Calocera cornea HHB12733]